jgi:hypothetical protein
MAWEINIEISKNFLFNRDGIEQKFEIRMRSKILDVSYIQSPCDFPRKMIVRKIELFKWWIESKDDVFFEGLCCQVVNQVMRKI